MSIEHGDPSQEELNEVVRQDVEWTLTPADPALIKQHLDDYVDRTFRRRQLEIGPGQKQEFLNQIRLELAQEIIQKGSQEYFTGDLLTKSPNKVVRELVKKTIVAWVGAVETNANYTGDNIEISDETYWKTKQAAWRREQDIKGE